MGSTLFFSNYSKGFCNSLSSGIPTCEDIPIDAVSVNAVKIFMEKMDSINPNYKHFLPSIDQLEQANLSQKNFNHQYCNLSRMSADESRICFGSDLILTDGNVELLNLKETYQKIHYSKNEFGKTRSLPIHVGFSGIRFRILRVQR
jgi:hypothetical protein